MIIIRSLHSIGEFKGKARKWSSLIIQTLALAVIQVPLPASPLVEGCADSGFRE